MEKTKKPVRWLRVALAALMAQLVPLLILVVTVSVYGFIIAPNQTPEFYKAFADQIGKYIGPAAGTIATLGFGFWTGRHAPGQELLHGFLTGLVVAVLDATILVSPSAEFDTSSVLVLIAKILAGALGGFLAKRRYENLPHDSRPGHRII